MAKDAKGHGSNAKGAARKSQTTASVRASVWDRMSPEKKAKMRIDDRANPPKGTYAANRALLGKGKR